MCPVTATAYPACQNVGVGRSPFSTIISTEVVTVAVAIVFPVCLIVALLKCNGVGQRKTVMTGDKIHAGGWPAIRSLEYIGRAVETRCQSA